MRPCSSVGRVTEDLIRRSWVRFPPRSKDFFFASCGSLFPFTRANAQWVIHGLSSTIIYTSELILCSNFEGSFGHLKVRSELINCVTTTSAPQPPKKPTILFRSLYMKAAVAEVKWNYPSSLYLRSNSSSIEASIILFNMMILMISAAILKMSNSS